MVIIIAYKLYVITVISYTCIIKRLSVLARYQNLACLMK